MLLNKKSKQNRNDNALEHYICEINKMYGSPCSVDCDIDFYEEYSNRKQFADQMNEKYKNGEYIHKSELLKMINIIGWHVGRPQKNIKTTG